MVPGKQKIILASGSPRRTELLKQVVEDFEVVPCQVAEVMDSNLDAGENALALAHEKARWVADRHPGALVIGADTIVVLDHEVIGKPTDAEDAREILKRLSGRQHQVITGVAVINPKGEGFQEAGTSCVTIKPLGEEEIERYIKTGEPMDKAGAYAIQGKGGFMVASYQGSYSNIVGLPLETLERLLCLAGYEKGGDLSQPFPKNS